MFSFFIPTVCPTVDQKQENVTQDNCILVTVIAAIMSVVSAVLLVAVISLSVTVFFLLAKNKRMATHASPTYQLEPTAQQPDAEYEVIPEGVSHHLVTGMKPNESYGKLQVWDANQNVPPETGGERTYKSVEVGN